MSEDLNVEPKQKIDFEKLEVEGWEFYHSKLPMMNTKELDQLADVIQTQTLPDILFGHNRLYFVNKKRDFLYEFSPIDSLSLSAFAVQKQRLHPVEVEELKSDSIVPADDEHSILNRIDLMPAKVEVKMADKWKDRDTSQIEDYKEIEVISDWTYSTPYKGTVLYLSQNTQRLKDDYGLDLELSETESSKITVERAEDEIPVHRLTPENPIIHYMEVELFEDELDDCGSTSSKVRFRIMKDWFYALVRYYLRVDGVLVRIYDTRIFHDFKTNEIIREFWHKEATFTELIEKGFDLGSEWGLDPNQADKIFNSLTLKRRVLDKITF